MQFLTCVVHYLTLCLKRFFRGDPTARTRYPARHVHAHVLAPALAADPAHAAPVGPARSPASGRAGVTDRAPAPPRTRPRCWSATPIASPALRLGPGSPRSEEHTSELQSLMRISYAVFCLKKKNTANKPYHANKR